MGEWKFANKFIELPRETIFRVHANTNKRCGDLIRLN